MGNDLYKSRSNKDFTCSSLTSRDFVPLCGDFMPVNHDSMPAHRDLKPVYEDSAPVYQDLMPVCQDFVPAPHDLPIVKDVCTTSDSVSEV